ncbi:Mu transposase C-terminal domain-containing protein [Vibrio mediterranei]
MNSWFKSSALTGLPGMTSNIARDAEKKGWIKRKLEGVQGRGFEYHISSLPKETQDYLKQQELVKEVEAMKANAANLNLEEPKAKLSGEVKALKSNELTDTERTKAYARYEVLQAFEQYQKKNAKLGVEQEVAIQEFVAMFNAGQLPFNDETKRVVKGVSRKTLFRWRKSYKELGLVGLSSRRKPVALSKIDTQPALKDFILSLIATYPHLQQGKIHRAMTDKFKNTDLVIPDSSNVGKWLRKWKKDNASLWASISNPDEWRNKHQSSFGSRSEHITELNQLWELDATPADLLLKLPDGSEKRYHISGLIDVWGRRPKFLVTETPKTEANACLLRRGILEFGKPSGVKLDNGSDYVSKSMFILLDSLDIDYDVCRPFTPEEKPHIERLFKSFSHDLLELKPGFIGHSVSDRKAIESRKSFAQRLMKKGETIEVTMTPEELQQFCDDWIENVYMVRKHRMLGMSPRDRVASYRGVIETITNERALDSLLSVPTHGGVRTVMKQGILIDKIYYTAPELSLYIGDQVQVRYDKDDLGQVILSELSGQFICIATNVEYQGVDRKEIAMEAKRVQRRAIAKAKKEINSLKRKYKTKEIADLMMDTAKEANKNVVSIPHQNTEEYTNAHIEGASNAANSLEALDGDKEFLWEKQEAMRKIVTGEDDTGKARFNRWIDLHKQIEAGEEIGEINLHWKTNYEKSSEFKGNHMVWEDFGDSAFR